MLRTVLQIRVATHKGLIKYVNILKIIGLSFSLTENEGADIRKL